MAASINDKATKSYSFLTKSLSSGINNTDTTIPFNNVTNIPTDTAVHFVIDRVDSNGNRTPTLRELCKGVVSGSNLINCTRGLHGTTAQSHLSGAVVEFNASAVGWNELIDAVIAEHSQVDGTHSTTLVTARTEDTAPDGVNDLVLTYDNSATALKKVKIDNIVRNNTQITQGWTSSLLPAVSSVTNNGNRSYDVTFGSTVASYLTPGMRVRTSRTVAAPTYMGGAFNGSNHYFTKVTCTSTLSTVTDNFTFMTFYQPTTYAVSQIGGRSDSASNNAMSISMEADGRVSVSVFNGGVANYRQVSTYQSLPLNKKTHIAATWASGTVVIYLDGISVPVATATTGGTAPTTAGTGGDFSIGRKGAYNANYSSGYISGFGVFNAVLSAATIRSYIPQVLSGSETNCIGAWSLNNTGVNQQAAGTNDLTATNSVGYTSGIAPYTTDATGTATGTYDYGIVTKVATTVATVQVPEGCTIPTSGGVSAVDLSAYKCPYGMPVDAGKWTIESNYCTSTSAAATLNTWYNTMSAALTVPVGSFVLGYIGNLYGFAAGASLGNNTTNLSLTAANATPVTSRLATVSSLVTPGANTSLVNRASAEDSITLSAAAPVYANILSDTSISALGWAPSAAVTGSRSLVIYARCSLL